MRLAIKIGTSTALGLGSAALLKVQSRATLRDLELRIPNLEYLITAHSLSLGVFRHC
jgi:hypothetical protein